MTKNKIKEAIETIEEMGFTEVQLKELLGPTYDNFDDWMKGQTVGLVEGKSIFYYDDVRRYLHSLK